MRIVDHIRASLFCIVVLSVTILSGCQRQGDERAPEKSMGALLLSRGGISDVQQYKDNTAIHGPTYFYFQASHENAERLINWLGLKKHPSAPDIFASSIKATLIETKWNFNLGASQVYLAYYCRPFDGLNWSLDLLLINDRNVIFLTDGYVPQNSMKTDEAAKCNGR